MDLLNLSAKKTSACRLVQNFTSLRASSVQAPCKFRASSCTCKQRKSIARFRATLLRCTCLRRNLWISYCMHPSCMKTCNAKALHVFMQLRCKNLHVSPSETCTHLVQATCVARDCRRALPLKENLTLTNKKWQPQHTPRKLPKNTIHTPLQQFHGRRRLPGS